MANGGGGTVVFGVRDRVVGHAAALLGVPAEIDINLLQRPRGRQRCPARGPEPHPRPHHGRQPHQHPGAWALPQPFRLFVADEGKAGRVLSVEHLLVLHHLLGALSLLPSRSRTEMSGTHCLRIFLERMRAELRASI